MIPHASTSTRVEDGVLATAIGLVGVLAITTGLLKPNGTETAIGLLLAFFALRVGLSAR